MRVVPHGSVWEDSGGDRWRFNAGWFYGIDGIQDEPRLRRDELIATFGPVRSLHDGLDLRGYVTEEEAATFEPVTEPAPSEVKEGTVMWLAPDVWKRVSPTEWEDHSGEIKTMQDFIGEAARLFSIPQTIVTGKDHDVQTTPSSFVTKDSGERQTYSTGMQRDTSAGKARFDLLVPEGVPYHDQFLTRFADLMARGAEKYDARNWEKAGTPEELARFRESAFRHFMQWMSGMADEDHAAAVVYNLMAHETTKFKIQESV